MRVTSGEQGQFWHMLHDLGPWVEPLNNSMQCQTRLDKISLRSGYASGHIVMSLEYDISKQSIKLPPSAHRQ